MTWRRPVAGWLIGPVAVLALAACAGDGGPSPSESAVCGGVQQVAERLAARDGAGALQATTRLAGLVRSADNDVLLSEGQRFFATIGERRDVGAYTTEEIRTLGQDVLEASTASLGRLVDECARVGAPVGWLDAVPDPKPVSHPDPAASGDQGGP